ncbi:MAG: alpha/beta fold hydrolase [Methanobacteriaceae archaeon]|nr:alpha/beta fold hydrolase [Methanobacteriaceae archaeon]MDO9627079.1 alpha/beta fold hydrolase [Methanobacteriaceae archaeon]
MAIENTFQHQQIDINGISTHIIEAGDNKRPTILFLHGYPENWGSFADVMALLKENYHILSLDMPGVGKSSQLFQ